MTLYEVVREHIGESGPQLPSEEYQERIDQILERMSPSELLIMISNRLDDVGITFEKAAFYDKAS